MSASLLLAGLTIATSCTYAENITDTMGRPALVCTADPMPTVVVWVVRGEHGSGSYAVSQYRSCRPAEALPDPVPVPGVTVDCSASARQIGKDDPTLWPWLVCDFDPDPAPVGPIFVNGVLYRQTDPAVLTVALDGTGGVVLEWDEGAALFELYRWAEGEEFFPSPDHRLARVDACAWTDPTPEGDLLFYNIH